MYEVILTERAAEDLRVNYQWWAENRSVEQSHRWYRGILNAMLSLEERPERFTLAEESPLFPFDAFQLNFGLGRMPTHRVIFTIKDTTIVILRVRHLSQDSLSEDDI